MEIPNPLKYPDTESAEPEWSMQNVWTFDIWSSVLILLKLSASFFLCVSCSQNTNVSFVLTLWRWQSPSSMVRRLKLDGVLVRPSPLCCLISKPRWLNYRSAQNLTEHNSQGWTATKWNHYFPQGHKAGQKASS